MNQYFLALDAQYRIAFKKKIKSSDSFSELEAKYASLGFICHLLEGTTFDNAVTGKGLRLSEESAFYIKRDLTSQFYFTDKSIRELLGPPDRIDKVKNQNYSMHQYARHRVEAVTKSNEYLVQSEKIKELRKKKFTSSVSRSQIPSSHSPFAPERRDRHRRDGVLKKRLQNLAKRLRKDWDLNEYKDFFITAREIKRKHVFFVGPTNSGKSYRGFQELAQAQSGVYLAPLRLLALEGQEEVEKRSKICSLLTGEEMDLKEDASFVASTIEMADLDTPVECALVDEVQLLLDPNRGWAWTQTLVGLPAEKIIMTGSPECIPALKKLIIEYLGEELEVIQFDRMGRLEMLPSLPSVKRVPPNTALIAFSRRAVLSLKRELEDAGRKVSVIYGNLSPGVRREEARRFRSGETDVLVATDCIGMGLNLPIHTVVFAEVDKFDGRKVRALDPQEVKQIAGRAGRFGKFECGYVGAMHHGGMRLIERHLKFQSTSEVNTCFVRPTESQLEILEGQIGNGSIKDALFLFSKLGNSESVLACSDLKEMLAVAERIENNALLAHLSFAEKYIFTCAPISSNDRAMDEYIGWLSCYAQDRVIQLNEDSYLSYFRQHSTSEDGMLNDAELSVKTLTLYHWLARKKPSHFLSLDLCESLRERMNTFIENSLKKKGLHKRCTRCGGKLAIRYQNKICDSCFRKKDGL